MELIHKLEMTAAQWFKNAPRMPAETTNWIARNMWWIVGVLILLGALGVIGTIAITFFAGALLTAAAGPVGAAISGIAMVAVLISLAFALVTLVIAGMAVKPLQHMKKRGWDLLFLLLVIEVASLAVTLVLTFNIFSVLWGLLWVALGAYVLFEIEKHFLPEERVKKPNEAKMAK